jgi:hypothetical protein
MMSLLSRMFGMGEQARPESPLELDLARLRRVAAELGEKKSALGLKGLSPSEQLHQMNRYFGSRLTQCQPRDRVGVASALAGADKVLPADMRKAIGSLDSPEARSVRETGCADLGRLFSPAEVEAIHAHLRSKPVLLAHDAHTAKDRVASLSDVPADQNYACYDYLDLWSAPHVMSVATQDRLLDLAQGYFGGAPTLYSINAFWSFPNRQPHPYSQVFHRDWEDYRSLVAFTLLTPVDDPEEGAHYYVETSHEVARFEAALRAGAVDGDVDALSARGTGIAPLAMKLFEHTARRFDGPAGRSFCGDGYGLHRAVVPKSRPRLLLWMRFGNFYNEAAYKIPPITGDLDTVQQVLRSISATPRHRYVFRYLIEALSSVPGIKPSA